METKVNREWGYRILTPTSLNFYHILLPQIGLKFLTKNLNNFKEIEFKEDKSVVITAETPMDLQILIQELESLLKNMETQFAQTDDFSYRIYPMHRKFLKDWLLSIESSIALIVISQCSALRLNPYDFELINSQVGGIYLHPFTVLFYEDHAKVIHPIRVNNFFLREHIERTISISMRGILQRVEQAQEGLEGMALISYVEEKTKLPASLIAKIVNEKAKMVANPKYSPLFQ